MRHCNFSPTIITFPQVNLLDYLRLATSDIIIILTQPAVTTTTSLSAAYLVRTTLLNLANQLQRIENLPDPFTPTLHTPPIPSSRVPFFTSFPAQPPRVTQTSTDNPSTPARLQLSIPISNLQQHIKQLKNAHFSNALPHRYPLHSKTQPT